MINYINLVFEQFGAKPEYILNFIIGLLFKFFMEHKIPVNHLFVTEKCHFPAS